MSSVLVSWSKSRARRIWHFFYPWTALNGLDRKLTEFLDFDGGVFIEAGANDGLRQSNTYYLEKRRGWSGLLVEPVPRLAATCRKIRRRSVVVESLLVAPEDDGHSLEILDLDLMSLFSHQSSGLIDEVEHAAKAEEIQGITRSSLKALGRTLSSIIDEVGIGSRINLLSLDVEGFELDVLRGLDLSRHCPDFILIETRKPEVIKDFLCSHYEFVRPLSHHDFLFRNLDSELPRTRESHLPSVRPDTPKI